MLKGSEKLFTKVIKKWGFNHDKICYENEMKIKWNPNICQIEKIKSTNSWQNYINQIRLSLQMYCLQ